eukprot:3094003-Lingulodinium_polyedra.AAC.1
MTLLTLATPSAAVKTMTVASQPVKRGNVKPPTCLGDQTESRHEYIAWLSPEHAMRHGTRGR